MVLDIFRMAIQDLEKRAFRNSPKFPDDKTAKAVVIENTESEPVPVYITDGTSEGQANDISLFDEVLSVEKEMETLVVQYLIPPNKMFELDRITCGGDNIAKYRIEINSNTNKVARTYEGSYLFTELNYSRFNVLAGQIIKVFAEHYNDDSSGNFEATIEGVLKNE